MSGVHRSRRLDARRKGGDHPAEGRGKGGHEGRGDALLLALLLSVLLHQLLLGEYREDEGRVPPGGEGRTRKSLVAGH